MGCSFLVVLGGTDATIETGSRLWLYGAWQMVNVDNFHWPMADYEINGSLGESLDGSADSSSAYTGGKGSLTWKVHCEFMVGSETIHPHFTQWVHAEFFLKVPTNLPPKNPPGKGWVLYERAHRFAPNGPGRYILGAF